MKVIPTLVTDADVDSWHWGLYANAESTTDIWEGTFSGATLAACGNSIGLDSTDLVDGRVLKMWTVKNNEVKDSVSVTLEVS